MLELPPAPVCWHGPASPANIAGCLPGPSSLSALLAAASFAQASLPASVILQPSAVAANLHAREDQMAAHFAPACCPNLDHNAAGGTSDAQRNIIDDKWNQEWDWQAFKISRRVRINHCLGTISTAQPPPASRRLADTASRISSWQQETRRIVAGTLPDQTCATTKPFILKTWITTQQHVTEHHYRLHRDATSLAAKGFHIFGLWARKSISMRLQTTSNYSVEFVSSAAQTAMPGKSRARRHLPGFRG